MVLLLVIQEILIIEADLVIVMDMDFPQVGVVDMAVDIQEFSFQAEMSLIS